MVVAVALSICSCSSPVLPWSLQIAPSWAGKLASRRQAPAPDGRQGTTGRRTATPARRYRANSTVLQTLPAAFDASTQAGLAALNIEVSRQAAMIAYVADFHVMMLITLVAMPLLLVRKPSGDAAARGGDVADVAH